MKRKLFLASVQIGLFIFASLIIYKYPPKYNWDIIPYAAIAKSYFTDDATQIHREVFQELQNTLSNSQFDKLVSENEYREKIFQNSSYLTEQLPFYKVKPLYPILLATFHALGFDVVYASIMISKLCIIFLIPITYIWICKNSNAIAATAISFFIFSSQQVASFSSWLTPDPLFCLLLLSFLYIFSTYKYYKVSFTLIPLILLCRPDGIMLIVIIIAYFSVRFKEIGFSLVVLILASIHYFIQIKLSGYYGWSTLFYHSFIDHQVEPSNTNFTLELSEYINVYIQKFFNGDTINMIWWIFLSGLFALFYTTYVNSRIIINHTLIILILFCIIHWLVFPAQKTRLLFPAYLMFAIVMTTLILKEVVRHVQQPHVRRRDAIQSRSG